MTETSLDVEHVKDMTELIANNGVMVVIAAVFILIVMALFVVFIKRWSDDSKQREEMTNKLLKTLADSNKELLSSLKTCTDKSSDSSEIRDQNFANREINRHMAEVRESIKADRLDCFLFTNGSKALVSGFRFIRFVRTFSCIRHTSELGPLQELTISFLPNFFDSLYTSNSVVVPNVDSVESDQPVLNAWITGTMARSAVAYLVGSKEEPIGFVTALYEGILLEEDVYDIVKELDSLAGYLGILLSDVEGGD